MISIEKIKHLYFEEKMSMKQIADNLNCSRSTINYHFKKAGLQARDRGVSGKFPHPNAVLTTTEVLSIRREFDEAFRNGEPIGPTLIQLSVKYNTSRPNVRSILLRETWKHI